MATSTLLEFNPLKWKRTFPVLLPSPRNSLSYKNHKSILTPPPRNPLIFKNCKWILNNRVPFSTKFGNKWASADKGSTFSRSVSTPKLFKAEEQENPVEIIAGKVLKALESLKKLAVAMILLGLLQMYNPTSAQAASGGRVGGSLFSSRSSSSSSRSSTSSSRSSTSSSRSSSPSFSSRSYSVPKTSGKQNSARYGSDDYSVTQMFGFSYPAPRRSAWSFVAGWSFFLVWMGFAAFASLVSDFLYYLSGGSVLTATEKTSVVKVQVGLLGLGRTIQKDLNRIAETADTSTSAGLSYVLTETMHALLRHPDYCISGYSSMGVKRSMEDGEKQFNQLSIEEHGNFDEETLVDVNNIRKQSASNQRASGLGNEYIVVTVLVATEGVLTVPTINGRGELNEALQKLGAIPSNEILAVEVLWTPQNENDTLTEHQLLEDYPLLRPFILYKRVQYSLGK